MSMLSQMLKAIALDQQIPILVRTTPSFRPTVLHHPHNHSNQLTNYSVSLRDTDPPMPNVPRASPALKSRTKPALGTTWAFIPSVRLYFTSTDDETLSVHINRSGMSVEMTRKQVEVLQSHRTVRGTRWISSIPK